MKTFSWNNISYVLELVAIAGVNMNYSVFSLCNYISLKNEEWNNMLRTFYFQSLKNKQKR